MEAAFVYIFLIVCLNVEFVELIPSQQIRYLKIEKGHYVINESIIIDRFSAISLAQCSYRCTKRSSPSLHFLEQDQMCHCNSALENNTQDDPSIPEVVYGYQYSLKELFAYRDCLEFYDAGFTKDGIYTIHPSGQPAVDTWCDMSEGGGWTVFQRRLDGSVGFYRGWSDYVNGFGNKTGEYWLGLDNLHALTTEPSQLHIYMESFGDVTPTNVSTSYSSFTVEGPSRNYRLLWDGFSITESCRDEEPVESANGSHFTTFDSDNDDWGGNCAYTFTGAWWYNACFAYNLNGPYRDSSNYRGVAYTPCWSVSYSMKTAIMKLRRSRL